jgi:hypothetical protein
MAGGVIGVWHLVMLFADSEITTYLRGYVGCLWFDRRMEETAVVQETPVALTAEDRCDVCGAQAYVRVSLATGELLFCGHHGKENKPKLEAIALAWHDETDRLLVR